MVHHLPQPRDCVRFVTVGWRGWFSQCPQPPEPSLCSHTLSSVCSHSAVCLSSLCSHCTHYLSCHPHGLSRPGTREGPLLTCLRPLLALTLQQLHPSALRLIVMRIVMVMTIKVLVTPRSRACVASPFCPALRFAPHAWVLGGEQCGQRVPLFLGEGVGSQGSQFGAANCVG